MEDVERLFWAIGLLLLLPFAMEQGFKTNAPMHMEAPALQSTLAATPMDTHGWYTVSEAQHQEVVFQADEHADRQIAQPLARLTVPTLRIDLPVVSGSGKPGHRHVQVITGGDLNFGKHIALATCFDGDAAAITQRIQGEWLYLQTQNRLRQYRVIDVREADPDAPALPAAFPSLSLVSCLYDGGDFSEQLILITAIEIWTEAHPRTGARPYPVSL